MKVRLELSCVEDDLMTALHEVSAIIQNTDIVSIEVKVFKDKNRNPNDGHSWVTMTKKSIPHDIHEIYRLKQEIKKITTAQPR